MKASKKTIYDVMQNLGAAVPKIRKVLVLIELTDGTFMTEDNGISVNQAEELVRGFTNWMRERNTKHIVEKKLAKSKSKSYVM